MSLKKDGQAILRRWQLSFMAFCVEALQVQPRKQQKEFIREFGKIWSNKFKKRILGLELTPEEEEYNQKVGISVMSGRGSGKDAVTSWAMIWVQTCFSPHEVMATGPSADHMKTVLWPEINLWLKRRRDEDGSYYFPFANDFEYTATAIRRKGGIDPETKIKYDDEAVNYAHYKTVRLSGSEEEQADGLSGHHSQHILFITDEGASLTYPVFKTLMGSLTNEKEVGAMINIFNPTRNGGPAYDIHFTDYGRRFVKLHWDLEECEGIDPDVIEDARKFGEDSNYWRINIKGLPPLADEDRVVPWEFITSAIDREVSYEEYDVIAVIDPAGPGSDKTVIGFKQGPKFLAFYNINGQYQNEIFDRIKGLIDEYDAKRILIDSIGVGHGLHSMLRVYYPHKVFGIDVKRTPRNPRKFRRLRDELWWLTREAFENGYVSIPDIDLLKAELNSPKYSLDNGYICVDSKKIQRKELGRSTDYADVVMLSMYHDFHKYDSKVLKAESRPWDRKPNFLNLNQVENDLDWMYQ